MKIAAAPGNPSPFHGLPWRAPGGLVELAGQVDAPGSVKWSTRAGLPSVLAAGGAGGPELTRQVEHSPRAWWVCKKCALTLHLSGPALVELVDTEPRGPALGGESGAGGAPGGLALLRVLRV